MIRLPEDVFLIHVLCYLDKRDLIDCISHVSNAWAKASLPPDVERWQRIGDPAIQTQFERTTKIETREQLLQMLRSLLVPFEDTDDSLLDEEIAAPCPLLEELQFITRHSCCPKVVNRRLKRVSWMTILRLLLAVVPTYACSIIFHF